MDRRGPARCGLGCDWDVLGSSDEGSFLGGCRSNTHCSFLILEALDAHCRKFGSCRRMLKSQKKCRAHIDAGEGGAAGPQGLGLKPPCSSCEEGKSDHLSEPRVARPYNEVTKRPLRLK